MINTKKKCFKMFDGAALHTIQKMSTPDMEELMEILAKEISARKVNEEDFAPMEAEMAHDSWVDNEQKRFGQMMADVA
jgi:hypothetical protein